MGWVHPGLVSAPQEGDLEDRKCPENSLESNLR